MLKDWVDRIGWNTLHHHAVGVVLCGLGMWWLLRWMEGSTRDFVVNEKTDEIDVAVKAPSRYSLVRCMLCSVLLSGLGYVAIIPLFWPIILNFPGFYFLYILLSIAIWFVGCKYIVFWMFGMARGSFVIMVLYVVMTVVVYKALAFILGLFS
jgi:hypothetical protein